jgi:hypothetical protein
VRDDFGIRLRDKPVALGDQLVLQLQVILHDAVVDHHDAAAAVPVRMRVFFGRPAVRRPARVADTKRPLRRVIAQHLFQVAQLARRAPHGELLVAGAAHRDAG